MPSVEATLEAVEQAHRDKPFYEHPLWAGLLEATFSKEQVKEFVRQFGIIPLHNHNYHGRLYVNCPNPHWRTRIAEVVYEEGTGRLFADGIPHNRLYLDVGNDLGISDEEMWGTHYMRGSTGIQGLLPQDVRGPDAGSGLVPHAGRGSSGSGRVFGPGQGLQGTLRHDRQGREVLDRA